MVFSDSMMVSDFEISIELYIVATAIIFGGTNINKEVFVVV